jgi:hypothetical protein
MNLSNDVKAVWVILVDQFGGRYLQSPQISINDPLQPNTWVADNIRPDRGIRRIVFLSANQCANAFFDILAKSHAWGRLETMPEGTLQIASIEFQ